MPLIDAVKYVAAAYVVFGALLFTYLGIMAAKATRMREEIASLSELLKARER
jgi:hypothetical protein